MPSLSPPTIFNLIGYCATFPVSPGRLASQAIPTCFADTMNRLTLKMNGGSVIAREIRSTPLSVGLYRKCVEDCRDHALMSGHRVRETTEQQHLHHRQEKRGGTRHALSVPEAHQWHLDPGGATHPTWKPQLHVVPEVPRTRGVPVRVPGVRLRSEELSHPHSPPPTPPSLHPKRQPLISLFFFFFFNVQMCSSRHLRVKRH
ncbi:hypothetical protein SKAU_G00328450 [Synaphobranchus kaupii]|uniref:Uncharacterized protein n=1 Tax=Synaphobranchus kaupii TaxID=118154 RepID=A0A9Q1IKA0_SYNKA|nr:hypothetical protein SKAU_G00328450 [Synaphobranchus kaupii]